MVLAIAKEQAAAAIATVELIETIVRHKTTEDQDQEAGQEAAIVAAAALVLVTAVVVTVAIAGNKLRHAKWRDGCFYLEPDLTTSTTRYLQISRIRA